VREGVKMRRCEDEKMSCRPPLLEEPCAQTLWGKTKQFCETSSIFELDNVRTKQFCDPSSFFEVDNIKNEAILRDFLQKWKVECSADGLVPMRFAIFPVHVSKLPLPIPAIHLPILSEV